MVLVQVGDSLLQVRTLLTLVNGKVEEIDERVQRELVHRVDSGHVVENEEQYGSALCARSVSL